MIFFEFVFSSYYQSYSNKIMLSRFISTKITSPLASIMRNTAQTRNFFTFVDTASTGVKTTFGKAGGMFSPDVMIKPGFRLYFPFIQSINHISNRQHQSQYKMSIKTQDNVFCDIAVNVQWKIKPDNTELAYFSLSSPHRQMKSYIENVIRSTAPNYNLDDLFVQQGDISYKINETLVEKLEEHGYTVIDTQITSIEPDPEVVQAMNKINASLRLKEAAKNDADAHYIKEIRGAEARSESKRLQGVGISNMRKAILDGYGESVAELSSKYALPPSVVLDFLLDIQKLETLDAVGTCDNKNRVIFTSLDGNSHKIRQAMMEAECVKSD